MVSQYTRDDRSVNQSASGWQGRLDLRLTRLQGKTVPAYSRTAAPLRLQRPFYAVSAPEECQSVMVHTAGGMVGGDTLTVAVEAEPHTRALITTAAAHKIYRCPQSWTRQSTRLTIAPHSCLSWLPQETILFDGGRLQQTLTVELAPEATWIGWDLVRLGRSARQESFRHGCWRTVTEVWRQGTPLWIDRQQVQGGSAVLDHYHGLGGWPVVGTFLLIGRQPAAEQIRALRDLPTPGVGEVGITAVSHGLVGRYRGPSSQEARRYFVNIWQYLRREVLGQTNYQPRVWGV